MRHLRSLALASALALSAQPALAADEAISQARLDAATALVGKMDLERTLDSLFNTLKDMFAQNVVASMTRGSDGAKFFDSMPGGRDRFETVLGEEFVASLRRLYPEFRQTAAREYAANFTEEELRVLNQFFSSGAGEKWRQMSPKLEAAMGKWGETAGMKAGTEAVTNTLDRLQAEAKQGTRK
ncbi:MAG: DUF2059 domain-containing protein [Sphingobium sp.]|nr:DUF2059 domain-containing protein [Sphingobium sp.]